MVFGGDDLIAVTGRGGNSDNVGSGRGDSRDE